MSVELSINVTGLDEAAGYFIDAAERLADTVGVRLADVCQDIVDYAKSIAPVKTGEYQASIGFQQTGPLSFTIFAADRKAAWIEFGTAPHIIIPKNVSVLRFEIEGEVIFAKYVLHPGTAPQMIIHTAKRENIPRIVEAITEGVREAFGH